MDELSGKTILFFPAEESEDSFEGLIVWGYFI